MEDNKKPEESIKEKILSEYKKGNIVVAGIDGLQTMAIDKFIKQPVDGILYDLNRGEETVLTFVDDTKWINDYAVCKTIRILFSELAQLKERNEELVRACRLGIKYTSELICAYSDSTQLSEGVLDELEDKIKFMRETLAKNEAKK